jgi:hypothetical protein
MEIPPALSPLFLAEKPLASRPTSVLYLSGLLLVTVAMVLLPVMYLGLTVFAGYGVFWFATECFVPIWEWHVSGRAGLIVKVLASCTPLLVGGCIALFMVKPRVARNHPSHTRSAAMRSRSSASSSGKSARWSGRRRLARSGWTAT